MNTKKTKDDLKPFGLVIQVCPECGKIDAYKDDNHYCDLEFETARQEAQDYYD